MSRELRWKAVTNLLGAGSHAHRIALVLWLSVRIKCRYEMRMLLSLHGACWHCRARPRGWVVGQAGGRRNGVASRGLAAGLTRGVHAQPKRGCMTDKIQKKQVGVEVRAGKPVGFKRAQWKVLLTGIHMMRLTPAKHKVCFVRVACGWRAEAQAVQDCRVARALDVKRTRRGPCRHTKLIKPKQ